MEQVREHARLMDSGMGLNQLVKVRHCDRRVQYVIHCACHCVHVQLNGTKAFYWIL